MYLVVAVIMAVVLVSHSCSDLHEKKEPEYHGVDPKLQPVVDQYLRISSQNNIVFSNQVTIGLKEINDGGAVGICNYGKKWREIDIDKGFWEQSSDATRYAVLFHELTHCYCGRDHDYGKDKLYKSVEELREETNARKRHEGGGFYEDSCPTSLMYPIVVQDECMIRHYKDYVKEMLDRCEPF